MPSNTEVYKIPGAFNTPPADWPRMQFPDLQKALFQDWVAEDLPLGELADTGWVSQSGLALTPNLVEGITTRPEVVTDAFGNKALRFVNSQLRTVSSLTDWDTDMTIEVVLRPNPIGTNVARIVSGPVGQFRGMYMGPTYLQATSGKSANPNLIAAFLGGWAPGSITSAIARYGASQVDGTSYGRWAMSSPIPVVGQVNPIQVVVGANSASPPAANTFMGGDIYRIRAWKRLLDESEIEYALKESSEIYGF